MSRYRILLLIGALLAATLACSLSTNEPAATPTPQPTSIGALSTPTPTGQPTQTTTPAATNTPFPTQTPLPTSAPTCFQRTDWPAYVVQAGDTLFGIALWTGTTVDQLALANCLANPNAISAGQVLRVPRIPPVVVPTSTSIPIPECPTPWFFAFEPGKRLWSDTCPAPVIRVEAWGQDFEGGRAYYYGPMGGDARGTIYVIYNNGYWETYPEPFPITDPGPDMPVPPEGRIMPVGQIGQVWRDHPAVRDSLGWALEPEQTFTGRLQGFSTTGPNHFYVDHGKWGVVLRMYPVNMGPNTWEVTGRY